MRRAAYAPRRHRELGRAVARAPTHSAAESMARCAPAWGNLDHVRRHRSKLKVLDNKSIVMTFQILGCDTPMALVGRVFTAEQAPTVEDLRGD
jgi:hypothetical protein